MVTHVNRLQVSGVFEVTVSVLKAKATPIKAEITLPGSRLRVCRVRPRPAILISKRFVMENIQALLLPFSFGLYNFIQYI